LVKKTGFGIQVRFRVRSRSDHRTPVIGDSGFRVSNFKFQIARLRRSFLELAPALPLCCLLLSGLLRAQIPAGTPTYNVNAKWVTDRGSQVFNVKAYGAVGNGTTNDTTAILAARTAAVAAHGILFFAPGSYPMSSQLV